MAYGERWTGHSPGGTRVTQLVVPPCKAAAAQQQRGPFAARSSTGQWVQAPFLRATKGLPEEDTCQGEKLHREIEVPREPPASVPPNTTTTRLELLIHRWGTFCRQSPCRDIHGLWIQGLCMFCVFSECPWEKDLPPLASVPSSVKCNRQWYLLSRGAVGRRQMTSGP